MALSLWLSCRVRTTLTAPCTRQCSTTRVTAETCMGRVNELAVERLDSMHAVFSHDPNSKGEVAAQLRMPSLPQSCACDVGAAHAFEVLDV